MIAGLYTSANGMVALEESQAAMANNIANVSTSGFRRHQPVEIGFYEVFSQSLRRPFAFDTMRAPGGGVKVVETFADPAPGILQGTSNPLDVAIEGPGFFGVDTPGGERFTRDGSFTVDVEGDLATNQGYKVRTIEGRPIEVRGKNIVVDQNGEVRVDGVAAGTIEVIEFDNPQLLRREGENLYRATDQALQASAIASDTIVHQSQLESSNVNLPLEMTNIMLALRAYEANQRAIHAADETMASIIEQVGMPR